MVSIYSGKAIQPLLLWWLQIASLRIRDSQERDVHLLYYHLLFAVCSLYMVSEMYNVATNANGVGVDFIVKQQEEAEHICILSV